MKRLATALVCAALAALVLAAPAGAAFGLNNFDVTFTEADGAPAQAGSHPFAVTFRLGANLDSELIPEGWLRDVVVAQIPGLVGDTTAYDPACTTAQFLAARKETANLGEPDCPLETQVGAIGASVTTPGLWTVQPLFNVTPPPGVLLRIGFRIAAENVFIDVTLNQSPPYNGIGASRNTPQLVKVFGSVIQLWGNPSDPRHDQLRGTCGHQEKLLAPGDIAGFQFEETGEFCGVDDNPKAFLTMPTDCSGPLRTSYEARSWNDRDGDGQPDTDAGSVLTPTLQGCGSLPAFSPEISTRPTSRAAGSPTGLDLSVDVRDEGLINAKEGARAQSTIRKVVLTLPEGMTANPAVAEGLEVCSQAELAKETVDSAPGEGCPQASKLGTLEVESPLVDEPITGALYQATPYENPFGSLIAFYFVLKNPQLGILVKQPAKVIPDPRTGRLIGITEDIPQLPFSHFRLHFREGARSPLVSPPLCGEHTASAEITPWSGTGAVQAKSSFTLISGPNEGPCPAAGTPPFDPGFQAGSESNAAGRYSPFSMRLTRRDGDQDLTRFDATLPPGVLAKLAGVDKCPDARIALAKTKTGIAELASPSCPANSRIGGLLAGAGVGSQLTYVPGSVYLAGPFGGEPLSALAVVPAVAGPFDVGTVVYRQALHLNPRTGQVTADGSKSDPLPHILAGIPLVVRDVQVHVDRSGFTLNPTSCDPFATKASIWGGGANPFSIADNAPVQRSSRYQAASCLSLGYKPRLSLKLKGGTSRGSHPALRAVLRPRAGDANTAATVVRLPRSAFLDQAHIRTICTRVQYAADNCPPGAVYGHVRAFSPLLAEPLEGPAYLRSSDNKLPDLVFSLRGLVDFEAVARLDSKRGGIRATFTDVPDAPISKVVVNMQGGKKGLIVNSRNLCGAENHANVRLDAHSGKRLTIKPLMQPSCGKQGGR